MRERIAVHHKQRPALLWLRVPLWSLSLGDFHEVRAPFIPA
jgi:hypothetical protein